MRIRTAGLSRCEQMSVGEDVSWCGSIEDGVTLDIGDGAWVIAFKDLERWYLAAKKAREARHDVS